jgi:hypothetical protein
VADINDIEAAMSVKIVGSNSTGVEQTPVNSTVGGALYSNLRDGSSNEIASGTTVPLNSARGLVVRNLPHYPPTFSAYAASVAIGNGKSMISVLNASGSSVVLRLIKIKIYNVQTTTIAGIMANFGLRRITAHSAGTQLTIAGASTGLIYPYDSLNSLNSSVTVRTGATVTESPAFDIERWLWSSDEFGPGASDAETIEHTSAQLIAVWEAKQNSEPMVLRAGQGLHIRQATNSTNGTFDLVFVFTQESA